MPPIVASLVAFPAAVTHAQNTFDYVEAGFSQATFDIGTADIDADVYDFTVSTEYKDRFLLKAEYARMLFDGDPSFDLQQDLYSIQLGYYHNVFRHVDVYAGIGYDAADSKTSAGSEYDYGLGTTVGFRARPFADWEFDASFDYTTVENPISLTGPKLIFTGEARWYFNDSLSLGFGGSLGEYESSWFGNFRFSFDPAFGE